MKKYLPSFLVFSIVLAGVLFLLSKNENSDFVLVLWLMYAYFCITTLLFHFGITKATASRPQVFVRYYMASTTFKLLLNLAIIVVFAILHKEMAVRFIVAFMIFYFLFSIFEMVFVWKMLSKKKEEK